MKLRLLGLVLALSIGCGDSPTGPSKTIALTIDFSRGPLGFVADFADYPPADAAIYALTADYRPLPPPLDQSKSALFISGINRSDDLFMFYRRQVGGLQPNQRYRATFEVSFATTARVGCVGVGGAEDSVWIKAGATTVEPTPVLRAATLAASWASSKIRLGRGGQGLILDALSPPDPANVAYRHATAETFAQLDELLLTLGASV